MLPCRLLVQMLNQLAMNLTQRLHCQSQGWWKEVMETEACPLPSILHPKQIKQSVARPEFPTENLPRELLCGVSRSCWCPHTQGSEKVFATCAGFLPAPSLNPAASIFHVPHIQEWVKTRGTSGPLLVSFLILLLVAADSFQPLLNCSPSHIGLVPRSKARMDQEWQPHGPVGWTPIRPGVMESWCPYLASPLPWTTTSLCLPNSASHCPHTCPTTPDSPCCCSKLPQRSSSGHFSTYCCEIISFPFAQHSPIF